MARSLRHVVGLQAPPRNTAPRHPTHSTSVPAPSKLAASYVCGSGRMDAARRALSDGGERRRQHACCGNRNAPASCLTHSRASPREINASFRLHTALDVPRTSRTARRQRRGVARR